MRLWYAIRSARSRCVSSWRRTASGSRGGIFFLFAIVLFEKVPDRTNIGDELVELRVDVEDAREKRVDVRAIEGRLHSRSVAGRRVDRKMSPAYLSAAGSLASRAMTEFVTRLLAVLAVGLQAALALGVLLALASLAAAGPRRVWNGLRRTIAGAELWLAWVVALAATLGSLYFSEVANFIPCPLCWYQRIAMYPLAVVLLVAALLRDRRGVLYAAALPLTGAAIATWHVYLERHPELEGESCRVGGAPCTTRWIWEFGYVSLPVLALTAFLTIGALLVFAWRSPRQPAD